MKRYVIRRIGRTRNMDREVYERHEAYQLLSMTDRRMVVVVLREDGKAVGTPRTVIKRASDRFFSDAVQAVAAMNTLNRYQNALAHEVEVLLKQNRAHKAQAIADLGGRDEP